MYAPSCCSSGQPGWSIRWAGWSESGIPHCGRPACAYRIRGGTTQDSCLETSRAPVCKGGRIGYVLRTLRSLRVSLRARITVTLRIGACCGITSAATPFLGKQLPIWRFSKRWLTNQLILYRPFSEILECLTAFEGVFSGSTPASGAI